MHFENSVNDLDWLRQHDITAITRRDFDWVLAFSGDVSLVVSCLWRLTEAGRIRLTSSDDGHKFGLPEPIDAERQLNELLVGSRVMAIELRAGTLDLRLTFDKDRIVEIIPDSSGYEAWTLQRLEQQYIAVGGGTLSVWDTNPKDRA